MTIRSIAIAAGIAAAVLYSATVSSAPVTADQAASRFAEEYGVRVLKTEETEFRGRRVFVLTVMNPDGNFNEAFQVSKVAVDAMTGALVSAFAHRDDGLDGNAAPQYQPNRQSSDSIRPGQPVWR